jgi:hypothetical protein
MLEEKHRNRRKKCWRKNIEIGENLLEEKHKIRKENPSIYPFDIEEWSIWQV